MRVRYSPGYNQLFFISIPLVFSLIFTGCRRSSDELPVMPPETHPLTREYIGFGVVNVSFTHILSVPGSAGVSQGYLRRGTVVRIIESRQVNTRGNSELWVLAEGNYQESSGHASQGPGGISRGWLQGTAVEIYDSEDRANTASKIMSQ